MADNRSAEEPVDAGDASAGGDDDHDNNHEAVSRH